MNLSLFFLIGCRKFLWSQFFITFELKFKHPSSYFDKLCSMLIIWMQGPFDSTLTRSQCRSECVPTTGNLVLVFQMRFDYCRQKQWLSLCAQSSCRSVTHQLPTVLSTRNCHCSSYSLPSTNLQIPCSVLVQQPAPLSSSWGSQVTTVTTLPCAWELMICLSAPI